MKRLTSGLLALQLLSERRIRGKVQSLSGLASIASDLNDPLSARATCDRIDGLAKGVLPEVDSFLLQFDHRRAMVMRVLGEYDSALVIADLMTSMPCPADQP